MKDVNVCFKYRALQLIGLGQYALTLQKNLAELFKTLVFLLCLTSCLSWLP